MLAAVSAAAGEKLVPTHHINAAPQVDCVFVFVCLFIIAFVLVVVHVFVIEFEATFTNASHNHITWDELGMNTFSVYVTSKWYNCR